MADGQHTRNELRHYWRLVKETDAGQHLPTDLDELIDEIEVLHDMTTSPVLKTRCLTLLAKLRVKRAVG